MEFISDKPLARCHKQANNGYKFCLGTIIPYFFPLLRFFTLGANSG